VLNEREVPRARWGEVILALYQEARRRSTGVAAWLSPAELDPVELAALLQRPDRIDYVGGIKLAVRFVENEGVGLAYGLAAYDRDNGGPGAADKVITSVVGPPGPVHRCRRLLRAVGREWSDTLIRFDYREQIWQWTTPGHSRREWMIEFCPFCGGALPLLDAPEEDCDDADGE
jgi:hypothetical protein